MEEKKLATLLQENPRLLNHECSRYLQDFAVSCSGSNKQKIDQEIDRKEKIRSGIAENFSYSLVVPPEYITRIHIALNNLTCKILTIICYKQNLENSSTPRNSKKHNRPRKK